MLPIPTNRLLPWPRVFLMIAPRIVSLAVAVYLIIVGLLGLNGIYHLQIVPGRGIEARAVLKRMSTIVNQFTFARHGAC